MQKHIQLLWCVHITWSIYDVRENLYHQETYIQYSTVFWLMT